MPTRDGPKGMLLASVLMLSSISWGAYGLFGFDPFDLMGPELTGAVAMLVAGLGIYDGIDTFGVLE